MAGLAKLTRPHDNKPVWISPAQVCSIQQSDEKIVPGSKTMIVLATANQYVVEAPEDAVKAIEAKL
jgi:hypothetical protein